MSLFRFYDAEIQREMVANRLNRRCWPEAIPPYCLHIVDWVWVCERNPAEAREREGRSIEARTGYPWRKRSRLHSPSV